MSRTSAKKLLTPPEARQRLIDRGESVQEFAKKHGLNIGVTYKVLYGFNKGRRGESHKAAVALGIKAKPQS